MANKVRMAWAVGLLSLFEPSVAQAGDTIVYTYDALGRLIATQSSGTVNDGIGTSYSYDPAGNRVNVRVSGGPVAPTCFYTVHDNLEGTAGSQMTFQITRTGTSCANNEEIEYYFTNGSAIQGTHFSSPYTHVQFGSGSTVTVTVNTAPSTGTSPLEFQISLSTSSPYVAFTDATATGRISGGASQACTFSAWNASTTAGYDLSVNFRRSGSCAPNQTVNFATADLEAIAGIHYIPVSGSVTFSGNATDVRTAIRTLAGSVSRDNAVRFYINVSSSNPAIQPLYPFAYGTIHAPGDD
jgi:hypothetical protein